jgi:integrase
VYGAIKSYITFLVDEAILDEGMEAIARRTLSAPKMQHDEDNISNLVLLPEQFNRVYEVSKNRNFMHYAMFKTMFWGQARRCEVIGLKISDVDFDNFKITYREEIAKGGKKATVNLSKECIDILKEYIEYYRGIPKKKEFSDILFLREGYPVSRTMIYEIHKEYSQILGFKIHPHMWRHTGITEYAKVEKDSKIVQKQARHDDVNITMRYINYTYEVYEKSYHEKFAKQKPIDESTTEKKPDKPKPQDTYIANPEPSKDDVIMLLKAEVEKLKRQMENQYQGYQ